MADRYWRGGTGTWNTTNTANWSATSGGAGGASVPTTADNVYFNSSSGSGTVTLTGALNALSLNFSGSTLTFVGSGSNTLTYHGSFLMGSGVTLGAALGSLESRGTVAGKTFNSLGKTLPWLNINFYATGGSMTLSSALTTSGIINIGATGSIVNFGNVTHTCGGFNLSTGTANFTSPGKVVISRSTSGTAFNMPTTTGSSSSITTYNRFEILSPPAGVSISVNGGYRLETNAAKIYYIASGTGTISCYVPTGISSTNGTAWSIEAGAGNYTIQGISAVRSLTIASGFTGTLTGNVGMLSTDATGCTLNFGTARTSSGYFYGLSVASGTNPNYLDTSLTMTADTGSLFSIIKNGIFTLRNNAVLTVTGLSIEPTLANSNIDFGTGSEKIVISKTLAGNYDAFRFTGYASLASGGLINRKPIEVTAPPFGQIYYIKLEEGIFDQQKHFSIRTKPGVGSAPFGNITFASLNGSNFTTGGTPSDLIMDDGDYALSTINYPNGLTVSGSITLGGSTVAPRALAYSGLIFVGNTAPQVITSVGGALVYFYLVLTNTSAGTLTLGSDITLDSIAGSTGIQFGLSSFGSGQGYLTLGSYTLKLGYMAAGVNSAGNVNVDFGTGKIRLASTSAFATQVLNLDTQYYGTISGSKIVEVEPYGTFAQSYTRYYTQAYTSAYEKSFTIRVVNNGSTGLVCQNANGGNLILEDGSYAFNGGFTSSPSSVQILQDLDILGSSINFLSPSSTFFFSGGAATSNFNTYGSTLNIYVEVSSTAKTLRLAGATSIATLNLPAGGIDLNNYTLTLSSAFTTTGTNTRTISFGTGSMVLTRSTTGTVFSIANQTNLTLSGTSRSVVITTPSSGQTKTITTNSGWTDPVDYTTTSVGTGGTIAFSSGNVRNFTIAGGTYTISQPASYSIYGDLTVNGAITSYTGAGTSISFAKSSGTQEINTNGNSFGGTGTIFFNAASTIFRLQGNSNFNGASNLTNGTILLNDYRLTTTSFTSSNSNVRTINFSNSGAIRLTGSGTVWDTSTYTNLSLGGVNRFVEPNLNGNQTLSFGAPTLANAFDISVPTTASNFTLTIGSGSNNVRNLIFSNVAYTVANTQVNVLGDMTILGTTPTFTSGTQLWNFGGTSGTQTITTNGKVLDFPIVKGGANTLQLGSDLTLTNRTFTLSAGTLDLQTRVLTVNIFDTDNTVTRSVVFGTGSKITVTNNAGSTAFAFSQITGMNVTGTNRTIESRPIGGSQLLNFGTPTSDSQQFDWAVSSSATGTSTPSGYIRNATFANAAYTASFSNALRFYGNFTCQGTSPTFSGTGNQTFAARGTQTITSSGETFSFPITIGVSGETGTVQLADALNIGTNALTHTFATFNAAGYNVTAGSYASNNSNTRALTMGNGTWTISGSGTPWNITTTTGMTLTRGTGSMIFTSASTKTLQCGGLTYPTITQGGSGTMIVAGTNSRFADLTRTHNAAVTIQFTSGQTFLFDDFTLKGVSAAARTSLSSTSTSQHTLSKSSGIVDSDFLAISYSNATGGAGWYAGTGSTQGTSVTGWIFTAAPSNSGNMFMLF